VDRVDPLGSQPTAVSASGRLKNLIPSSSTTAGRIARMAEHLLAWRPSCVANAHYALTRVSKPQVVVVVIIIIVIIVVIAPSSAADAAEAQLHSSSQFY